MAKGEWVAARWNRSYVHNLLADRRALGEHLPLSRTGVGAKRLRADGPPIKDYFPAVVDEETFAAVRATMTVRKPGEGRRGEGRRVGKHIDLFSRKISTPWTAGPTTRRPAQRPRKTGANSTGGRWLARRRRSKGVAPSASFPLPTFERAIRSALKEVDPREVLGQTSPALGVAALERQVCWLQERQAELGAELRNGDVPVIARQLRRTWRPKRLRR